MQKLFLGILATSAVMMIMAPLSEAGHRRGSRRALRYTPCVQPCPVQRCPVQPCPHPAGQAQPSLSTRGVRAFPDVCPVYPLTQVSGDIWVWFAYRHYGEGLDCSNSYIEATTLTGDYDRESNNWPYPCGHEMCEPDLTARSRAVPYEGVKGGLPVDFAYSPVSEIPRQAMAQEILPRAYYSFNDKSDTPRTRYFIGYHIKTNRHQFTIAHEVDLAILEREGVTIHPLSDEEMQPADEFGHVSDNHSFVYLHKPEGKLSDIVFYLKR